MANELPEIGFLRLKQIIGDPKAEPPIPAIIPISKSQWFAWIRAKKAPAGISLGPKTTVWTVKSIRIFCEQLAPCAPAPAPETLAERFDRLRQAARHAALPGKRP